MPLDRRQLRSFGEDGYIEWLQAFMPHLQRRVPQRIAKIRGELHQVGSHLRQADALAQLLCSFEMLLEFAQMVGAMTATRAEVLLATARETLAKVGETQGSALKDLEPAERFVTVLGTLLEQQRIRLAERGCVLRSDEVEAIDWYDDQFAYLMPEAARRRVATFLRESGDAWSHSSHALHKALVRKGYAEPGPDGRPEVKVRIGEGRRRVLRIRRSALYGPEGPGVLAPT